MQKVLVLGAGLVARPLVEYLLEAGYQVNIACNTIERADSIINNHPLGKSVYWEADETVKLDQLVASSDITVSLLPFKFHTEVARACLKHGKSMVTTSYVKDEMAQFDNLAKSKNIILLNEIGLDPGIDHMTAMRVIDMIHSEGGVIEKFYSLCGALPSPEFADNPMKYKFSWSPKGVISASLNSAVYIRDGKRVEIEADNLFKDRFSYNVKEVGTLEVYPNRDSVRYADIYGIESAGTVYRGTFRFKGWCETLDAMKQLRMLDCDSSDYSGKSYSDFMEGLVPRNVKPLEERIAGYLEVDMDSTAMESFRWLGLFSKENMKIDISTPFDIISDLMISKMMLGSNEKDMIILQHLFQASYPDGRKNVISSHMIDYGSPVTNTSIARTVGLPAAIAVKLILQGKINLKGVCRPVVPEIYIPVLEELEKMDIRIIEEYGLPAGSMID
jgi:saccharopine dehydrogenase-like NADP-dependent oxidoreductase